MHAGPEGTQAVLQVQKQSRSSRDIHTVFLKRQQAEGVQEPAPYQYEPATMRQDNEAVKETYPQGLRSQVRIHVVMHACPVVYGPTNQSHKHHKIRAYWSARSWKHGICLLLMCLVCHRTFLSRSFSLSCACVSAVKSCCMFSTLFRITFHLKTCVCTKELLME